MSEENIGMKIDTARVKTLASNLQSISERVSKVANGRNVSYLPPKPMSTRHEPLHYCTNTYPINVSIKLTNKQVRVVAVSKLKPASDILRLIKCIDKCKLLASSIPNLWCVSSVDSIKKATQLDIGRASLASTPTDLLNVHVQVNTSGEESKSGCQPGQETLEVCRHIKENCGHLKLLGLMTIGAIARSRATTPETENDDFLSLKSERDAVSKELRIDLELSMGMSDDFEGAISQGSDEVRVGSTIFGERPAKADFNVKGEVEDGQK